MNANDGAMRWRELPLPNVAEPSTCIDLADARTPIVTMVRAVHRDILAHVEGDLTLECAGLLFGNQANRREDHFDTLITASRPVLIAEASLTHFIMQPETWPAVWRELSLEHGGIEVCGWYHSHPGHGAFLSATDRTTQALWFRQPWHVAFVIDPIRRMEAVFCGAEGVRAELMVDAG